MQDSIAVNTSSRAVRAPIEFLVPGPGRLFSYSTDPAPNDAPATATFEARPVVIYDVRAAGTAPSLDANGAALLRYRTEVRDFYDDDEVQRRYYPEVAGFIRAVAGASRVLVFDHNVRRGEGLPGLVGLGSPRRPVMHAHTDFTAASARRRLLECLDGESFDFDRRHYLQVNLWRPIRSPLRDAPLAICDGATVAPESLSAVELVYPTRRGEIHYLSYDASQRWFYAPDMETDEVWLIKNFDSAAPTTVSSAPHSAFQDPTVHDHVLPRESIEVRAFALFD